MRFGVASSFKTGYFNLKYILEKTKYRPEFVLTSVKDNTDWEFEISKMCREYKICLIRHIKLNDPDVIDFILSKKVDLGFLLWWSEILKINAIKTTKIGWVNTHPSYLPFNRGKNPYYWSIVEGTPYGVTLHFIDEGIDTGKILYQKEIPVEITDTGESLYKKSEKETIQIFQENFENIMSNPHIGESQNENKATAHLGKDLTEEFIELDRNYKAITLINKIRARTFQGGPSNFFYKNGKKYYIRIEIAEA